MVAHWIEGQKRGECVMCRDTTVMDGKVWRLWGYRKCLNTLEGAVDVT